VVHLGVCLLLSGRRCSTGILFVAHIAEPVAPASRRGASTLQAIGDMNAGMPERSPVQAAVAALGQTASLAMLES
jgi:hypothetical protein